MIPALEVTELLRRLASGAIVPSRIDGVLGDGTRMVLTAEGWQLAFFDDSGELDYVDSCIAPDGRTGDYDRWCNEHPPDGDPLLFLSERDLKNLERLCTSGVATDDPSGWRKT